MVGGGSNVGARDSYSEKALQVIVSRSHEGKVKEFVSAALGNDTVFIPAGGAGIYLFFFFFLSRFEGCLVVSWTANV